MHDYFRGNPERRNPLELLRDREPIRPEYRDRDARLATLDEQGLEACWLFPTLGMLYEELLKHDPEAVCRSPSRRSTAGSRRTGASPTRTASSPRPTSPWPTSTGRCAELEWALDHGARTVVMRPPRPPPPPAALAVRPDFDPFWARVDEAGITVVVHAGDSGYTSNGYARDGFAPLRRWGSPRSRCFARARRLRLPRCR
jgi:hypothetical protein